MHKVENNEEHRGNIFSEGIAGWKWLFSKLGSKKQPQQQSQQQNNPQTPQNPQQNQN